VSQEIFLYRAQEKIYPRSVGGVFARWRWGFVWLTQLLFYGLPWLPWGDRQAVLFDIVQRRFYIFKLVLYPQDFIYLTALLVISAMSLFLFTAVAGRLWCGYTCPQTVYTEMFMWLERRIEGDRMARMRRDAAGWSWDKVARKGGKHAAWLALAFWTGFSFVGYFTPIRVLSQEFIHFDLGSFESFWVFFYGFATYGNAGFLREQVCKYMCPYARFQSAMFDRDTLIVSYDQARGEPRGAPTHKASAEPLALGACVDCDLCVQVCPTGIDIRKGLQYECIGCGACADVCDTVMDKLQRPRGLVRYSTENAMEGKWTQAQMLRRVFRPRVLVYTALLWTLIAILAVSLWVRKPLHVDVERDRSSLARIVEAGRIENVYRLQVMNASEGIDHVHISVSGIPGLSLASEPDFSVDAAQSRWIPVRVQLPYDGAPPGSHPIAFHISEPDSGVELTEKAVFLVPR
jgi:cytochrome c oxidase accessory protein FixG